MKHDNFLKALLLLVIEYFTQTKFGCFNPRILLLDEKQYVQVDQTQFFC